MKKVLSFLIAVFVLTAALSFQVYAADSALFDNFDRTEDAKDLAGGVNTEDRTVWWTNWDPGTSIEDGALKLTGEAHFGAGIDTGTDWKYLLLTVKGDATGILVAPGGAAVAFEDLKGADGAALPALTGDWQDWLIDIDASGLTRDAGMHLNTAAGTLYVDQIVYTNVGGAADTAAEAEEAPAAAEEAPAEEAVVEVVEFPASMLVDDFERPADEADNSGGVNSEGLDTWWYNAYDFVIEDGALVAAFDGDANQHFGVGANVAVEAEYKYLVMRVKGVDGGDYSGLLLNLGAKNPVLFSDMKGADGGSLPAIGTDWVTLVIDLNASGIVFDQGFHLNSDKPGTLYIDTIYYTSTAPEVEAPAVAAPVSEEAEAEVEVAATAAEGEEVAEIVSDKELPGANPQTGDNNFVVLAAVAVLVFGAGAVVLGRKALRK
ncbi:MAG: hypothetical protein LBS21_03655 [Clostridiales bacterium]|jgi:LPXTG-motif cell wall-anchored protein|nr:hypothetical protein [Clostridiales bacterium]